MLVQLESPRLILDEICAEDIQALHRYASDAEVVRYQNWGPNTYKETEEFVEQVLQWQQQDPRKFFVLALRKKGEQRMLGAISLEIDEVNPHASFGFSLARDAWGQGLATEAGLSLISYAMRDLQLTHLNASCDKRNKASQAVLRKCGFRPIGVIHQHMMLRDGPRDTLLFERVLRFPATYP